jgi:hypothetical protein
MADYYIPANDAKFDLWFRNLADYVAARVAVPDPA